MLAFLSSVLREQAARKSQNPDGPYGQTAALVSPEMLFEIEDTRLNVATSGATGPEARMKNLVPRLNEPHPIFTKPQLPQTV
jgi:hypothetical protein